MIIITPEQFKKALLKVLEPSGSTLISIWYGHGPEFTKTMRKFFDEVANNLKLNIYNRDYYTLDAIFYEEKDTEHFSPATTYAKYIAIALEHENALDTSVIEINKLQLFNAPLKVLITYVLKETQKSDYLKTYSAIIKEADIFGDISTQKKQLVIFGFRYNNEVKWSFHVYKDGGFVEI